MKKAFKCPRCGMVSYGAEDLEEGYCGNCHDWTAPPYGLVWPFINHTEKLDTSGGNAP